MLDYIKRLSPQYIGVGLTTFAFAFRIFEETDVYVKISGIENELVKDVDYTVSVNLSTQETSPGGSITLIGAYSGGLTSGQILVIGSKVPWTQTMQLTNQSRFPPEIINTSEDRIVAQIQQLVENSERTLTVDQTSTKTPKQLMDELLDNGSKAGEAATRAESAAAQAAASKTEAANHAAEAKIWAIGDPTEPTGEYSSKWYAQHVALVAKGAYSASTTYAKNEWVTVVGASSTNAYVSIVDGNVGNPVTDTTKWALMYSVPTASLDCQESVWTTSTAIPAGSVVTIPSGTQYIVGKKQLIVSVDGFVFYRGLQFNEYGTAGSVSTQFVTLAKIPAGSEIMCWVPGTGDGGGGSGGWVPRVTALETDVSDLKNKIAYVTPTP